jgi:chromate transport protein ChrA
VIEVARMILLSITWVLLLLALLRWWAPDAEYSTEPMQRALYHGVWLVMAGLLAYVHYQLMAKAGHRALAVALDVAALALFVLLRWFRTGLQRQVQ